MELETFEDDDPTISENDAHKFLDKILKKNKAEENIESQWITIREEK